jgi:hypothetical protein
MIPDICPMMLDTGLWMLDFKGFLFSLSSIEHPVPPRRDIARPQAMKYYFPPLVGLRRSFAWILQLRQNILKKIVSFVIHYDKGGKILDRDYKYGLHSQFRIFKYLNICYALFPQSGSRPSY